MQKFSMVGGYTWKTSKNHKTVKIGGWAFAWEWALAWDNTVLANSAFPVRGTILFSCKVTLPVVMSVDGTCNK